MKKSHVVILVTLLVLILDQWVKIYVKTHFIIEESVDIFGQSWAQIHFTENEGMAFGITLAGDYGKLFLSLFRILAVGFLAHFIYRLVKAGESIGLLISFTLIMAGAVGNVLDCVFYGALFSASGPHSPAVMFPDGGGYAPFLYGKVVDMLYFPMVDTRFPEWMPFWGGERFQFFRFIFNIADAAITTGVISILLFHRKFFKQESIGEEKTTVENENETAVTPPIMPGATANPTNTTSNGAFGEKIADAENVAQKMEEQISEKSENLTDEDQVDKEV